MSGWNTRVFAAFSIIWWLIVTATVALAALSDGYMLSPNTERGEALLSYVIIIGVGAAVWYSAYRLARWFDERG